MSRHRRDQNYSEEINVWASFTDLMSNAFMILSLLLLLTLLKPLLSKSGAVKSEVPREFPPSITIRDAGNFRFSSGRADLSPAFQAYIKSDLITKILENVEKYEIDTILVIGHTDGQANGSVTSNLDQNLELVASGRLPFDKLLAGSNADLGLMRALAVVNFLQASPSLKNLKFRAYSAAQLLEPNGNIAEINRKPDGSRRRIEITFTRSSGAENIN